MTMGAACAGFLRITTRPLRAATILRVHTDRSRVLGLAALVALVAVNVVIFGLLSRDRPPPPVEFGSVSEPAVTEPAEPEDDATTDGAEAGEPPDEATAAVVLGLEGERFLAAASDLQAWRGVGAACGEPGAIEATVDGGTTWSASALDASALVALRAVAASGLLAVVGDEECEPIAFTSPDGGLVWDAAADPVAATWHVLPADRDTARTPEGLATPCSSGLAGIASLGAAEGAVLCGDGDVATSSDGGLTWQPVLGASGIAIASSDEAYVIGSSDAACDGVVVRVLTHEELTSVATLGEVASECLPVADPASVELALSGETVWIWSGELTAPEDLEAGAA